MIFNFCDNLFDYQRTSAIISISYATSIIFICTVLFYKEKSTVQIQLPDILVATYFLFGVIRNGTCFNINHLGDIALLVLYIGIRIGNYTNYKILYTGILVGCFLLSAYGYLQYAHFLPLPGHEYRILGPFYNPAPYGALLCFFLSVQVVVLTMYKKVIHIFPTVFVTLFSLPAFILSESRAAWTAFFIVILYTLLSKYYNIILQLSTFKKKGFIIFFIILFIPLCIFTYNIRSDSAKGRVLIWKISSEMIKDAPFFGLGYNGFEANYMNYQGRFFEQKQGSELEKYLAGNVVSAYNEPIRITVEYGIIGLTLYLLLIYTVLFRTKTQDIVSKTAKTVVIAYITFGLFSYPNRICSLQVVIVVSLAYLLNRQSISEEYTMQFRTFRSIMIFKFSALLLILLFVFHVIRFQTAYRRFQSLLNNPSTKNATQLKALNTIMSDDYLFLINSNILEEDTISYNTKLEKLNKAILLSPSTSLYRMKGDCLVQLGKYEEAEQVYWTAHYMVPSRQQARARLAKLYLKTNKIAEAKQLALSILNEKVKDYNFSTYTIHQEMETILSTYK